MKNGMRIFGMVIILCVFCACVSNAQMQDQKYYTAAYIKANIQFLMNVSVKVKGVVKDVKQSTEIPGRGQYILVDDYGDEIPVLTTNIVGLQLFQEVVVQGKVAMSSNMDPYLVEERRSSGGLGDFDWKIVVPLILGGLLLLIGLLYLIKMLVVPDSGSVGTRTGGTGSTQPETVKGKEGAKRSFVNRIKETIKASTVGNVEVIEGPDIGRKAGISTYGLKLGRTDEYKDDNRALWLSADTVSRTHARITYNKSDKIVSIIHDDRAGQPLVVNDNEVQAVNLKDGDIIELGEDVLRISLKKNKVNF